MLFYVHNFSSTGINESSPRLLFGEKAAWGAPVAVAAVGRRVLGVIVVVVSAGQDGAYAAGSDWKKKNRV